MSTTMDPPQAPTDHRTAKAEAKAAKARARAMRPAYAKKRTWLGGAVLGVVGISVIAGIAGGGDEAADTTAPAAVAAPADAASAAPAVEQAPSEDSVTASQKQALRAAKQYLDLSAFSHAGLVDQLSSDAGSGFSVEDATWAADNAGADWNEQAARAAKQYLELSAFSHDGLVDQLTSAAGAQFTPEQAEYGVAQAGL